MFSIPNDKAYEQAIKILAVLYVRDQYTAYINYMAETKAFAAWLIPHYDNTDEYGQGRQHTTYRLNENLLNIHSYELQELCKVWRLDAGGVYYAILWAEEEVAKHDPSNTQTSFPFEFTTPAPLPTKVSTHQTFEQTRGGER
jgi:hypothetical protein